MLGAWSGVKRGAGPEVGAGTNVRVSRGVETNLAGECPSGGRQNLAPYRLRPLLQGGPWAFASAPRGR